MASVSADLQKHLEGIIDGTVYNVSFPYPLLTKLTFALMPGTITVLCGNPSCGKTFFILDCLRHWHGNDIPAAVYFIEKDPTFYAKRLLAQLEGNANYADPEWIRHNADEVRRGHERNRELLDALGNRIYAQSPERMNLRTLAQWVDERGADGNRVIVVDPVTMIDAGANRWTEDDLFLHTIQKSAGIRGTSIVLVTHPKGGAQQKPSMHVMAGGAAYSRFSDCALWLEHTHDPRTANVRNMGLTAPEPIKRWMMLHKTRDGKGGGMSIAFRFTPQLTFKELGIIVEEDGGHDEHAG